MCNEESLSEKGNDKVHCGHRPMSGALHVLCCGARGRMCVKVVGQPIVVVGRGTVPSTAAANISEAAMIAVAEFIFS